MLLISLFPAKEGESWGKKCSWNHRIQPDGEFTPLPPLFSLPTEVCTVVSDVDCHVPVMTICNAVSPSSDCQLILRHYFKDSGIFCVNVSMTNDVSLAFTNARVNINIGEFIYLQLKHKAWCSKNDSSAVNSSYMSLFLCKIKQIPGWHLQVPLPCCWAYWLSYQQ